MKTCKELKNILDSDTCEFIINVYNDQNLSEMARAGKLPDSKLEIHLEGSECSIPNFHIQVKNGKPENTICHIKLLANEYLRDKDDPMKTLNSNERIKLNDYLHKNLAGTNIMIWKVLLGRWNEMNPNHIYNIDNYSCPDYTEIKEEE
jgi:hypothetical protein